MKVNLQYIVFLRSALYDDEFRLSAVLKYGIFRANTASATKKTLKSNTYLYI